ncbi:MAG: hypothetical protein LUQ25_08450 [Methanoregulaceae archaeon]|nr:hypothetical protein [Methanoregulaceae archaeon]
MEEGTKERFRWKFYSLTILLNLFVLLIALAVISYVIAPPAFRIALPIILLAIAGILGLHFVRKYREARRWLDENA